MRRIASLVFVHHHHHQHRQCQWLNRFKPISVPSSFLVPHSHFQALSDVAGDVNSVVQILVSPQPRSDMRRQLEHCAVAASPELVAEVLSRVRNDWEAAYTFFLWAGKQGSYSHSVRHYHSMISILGKMNKFDTAWSVVDEMTGRSLVTSQTLMIMIRRYCAAHDVARAISTFHAHKRFRLDAGMDEFHGLLSALCRYKNVKDAEHLLFSNALVFPFNTKSFNIVLNGWCSVIGSPREAHRIWWEMSRRRLKHDAVSFAAFISCHSKSGNLNKVLRLFDRMNRLGIDPDLKVYNSVIFALAKAGFVDEAVKLVGTMEDKGIPPNAVTYNSLIKPLCKARKLDQAWLAYDDMFRRGLCPTVQTYHAFFRTLRTAEEVFTLLDKMRATGCQPDIDTLIMLIRKFSRWRQLDNVFKLWDKMSETGASPDRSAYIVLIHGLFLNGKLDEAHKYYLEMKEKQYLPEPKTEEMLQAWLSGKQVTADVQDKQRDSNEQFSKPTTRFEKLEQRRRFLREPEARKVVRERGFSFWDR